MPLEQRDAVQYREGTGMVGTPLGLDGTDRLVANHDSKNQAREREGENAEVILHEDVVDPLVEERLVIIEITGLTAGETVWVQGFQDIPLPGVGIGRRADEGVG